MFVPMYMFSLNSVNDCNYRQYRLCYLFRLDISLHKACYCDKINHTDVHATSPEVLFDFIDYRNRQ